jgi:SAM-dependent methyltransferase
VVFPGDVGLVLTIGRFLRFRLPAVLPFLQRRPVRYLGFSHGDPVRYRRIAEVGPRNPTKRAALAWLLADPGLPQRFSLLDVGCGPGGMARLLLDGGEEVARRISYTGLDQSAEAIAFCRQEYPSHLTFVHRDVLADGLPEGPYDVVAMNEILEHLPDYRPLLDRVAARKPRVLVLTTFGVIPGLARDRRLWRPDMLCYMNSYAFGPFYARLRSRTSGAIRVADFGIQTFDRFWFPRKAGLLFYVQLETDASISDVFPEPDGP